MSIVFKPERLENSIKVEGVHGTPKDSKVILDGYGMYLSCVHSNVHIKIS